MADELADLQNTENQALETGPIGAPEATEPEIKSEARAEKPEKQEKLSIREALNKAVADAKKDDKGRLHHPKDGKFVPKVEAEKSPAEIQATEKDVQPSEASKPVIGPPPGWSPASKAAFDSLPDPVKQDILKREQEVSSGFKQKSDELKRYQDIEQVIAPARQTFQRHGVTSDAEAIKRLFMWEGAIRANPVQAISELARQYGVNLSSGPQPQAFEQEIPAQLRPVIDQFGNITQKVSALEGELQRSREERVSQDLAAFAKDHPHFEKARVRMGQLIQAGAVQPNDLEGAYQQAIWADADIRAALIKEQTEKQLAEATKLQTQRAQAARAASVSPSGRAPTGSVNGAKPESKGVRGAIMSSIESLRDNRA